MVFGTGRVKLETLFSHTTKVEFFNMITALSRNRTRVAEAKGMCANHRTTNTPNLRQTPFVSHVEGHRGCHVCSVGLFYASAVWSYWS